MSLEGIVVCECELSGVEEESLVRCVIDGVERDEKCEQSRFRLRFPIVDVVEEENVHHVDARPRQDHVKNGVATVIRSTLETRMHCYAPPGKFVFTSVA